VIQERLNLDFTLYFCNKSIWFMAKKLPIGLQDFRKIIENDFKYVDKTEYLYQLVSNAGAYFISRPRRFGKSITIATLQEIFNCSRELFKGLWIEDKWDWSRKHPVIRITLTGIGFPQSGLVKALDYKLNLLINEHGLDSIEGAPGNKLEYLIVQLSKLNKVVVLVDEYDAPIVHYLGKEVEQAYINRDILREFYTVLKNNDHLIEFVFITGVSKFSKVGIFSGLNNLQDITMHPQYATMLGYTQEELEDNFSEEIAATADHMKTTPEELLEKMRLWYNGYRFEENAPTVYNPVSINTFFSFQKFQNFWFATGTPSFLINLLKEEGLYDLNFDHLNPTGFDSFELDNLKLAAILYQTGYLTIKDKDEEGLLTLDYPNKEVRDAMLEHFNIRELKSEEMA